MSLLFPLQFKHSSAAAEEYLGQYVAEASTGRIFTGFQMPLAPNAEWVLT
jgi:hypothetical protein